MEKLEKKLELIIGTCNAGLNTIYFTNKENVAKFNDDFKAKKEVVTNKELISQLQACSSLINIFNNELKELINELKKGVE